MPPRAAMAGSAARRRKVSEKRLALYLQTDDEKEYRHQSVVYPFFHRKVNVEQPEVECQVGFENMVILVVPGRVRPHERGNRRGQQNQATHGLGVNVLLDGQPDSSGDIRALSLHPQRASAARRYMSHSRRFRPGSSVRAGSVRKRLSCCRG